MELTGVSEPLFPLSLEEAPGFNKDDEGYFWSWAKLFNDSNLVETKDETDVGASDHGTAEG